MLSRRRTTRLSAAAFVAAMLIAPAAGAQTPGGSDDPVTIEFGGATVSVFGHPISIYQPADDAPPPDTKIGARADAPVAGEQDVAVSHTAGDGGERPVVDPAFAAACEVARQGDPVTYCETNQ